MGNLFRMDYSLVQCLMLFKDYVVLGYEYIHEVAPFNGEFSVIDYL